MIRVTTFLFIALWVGTLTASAQETSFGVKAGLSLSGFNEDLSADTDAQTGFVAGVLVSINFSDIFSLQPEVLYSQQGANPDRGDNTFIMDYINVPILAKFFFLEGWYGAIGPQFGFSIRADTEDIEGRDDLDLDDTKTFAFAVPVGTGYQLDSGLGLDVRYNVGLTDVFDAGADSYNEAFQATVFWIF